MDIKAVLHRCSSEVVGGHQCGKDISTLDRQAFGMTKIISEVLRLHKECHIWGELPQCHIYCDCMSIITKGDFTVHDGYYGFIFRDENRKAGIARFHHSWMTHRASRHIYDIRPVGQCGGPVLYVRNERHWIGEFLFHEDSAAILGIIRKIKTSPEYARALKRMVEIGLEAMENIASIKD